MIYGDHFIQVKWYQPKNKYVYFEKTFLILKFNIQKILKKLASVVFPAVPKCCFMLLAEQFPWIKKINLEQSTPLTMELNIFWRSFWRCRSPIRFYVCLAVCLQAGRQWTMLPELSAALALALVNRNIVKLMA